MNKSIFKYIAGCHQNRNSSQTFLWDNFTHKNFEKLSLVDSLFNITRNYSLPPRTVRNSATDDFMREI